MVGINRLACYVEEQIELMRLGVAALGGWVDWRKGWGGTCMTAGAGGREGDVS